MGWADLIEEGESTVILPWLGGPMLQARDRVWRLGATPLEPGWYTFTVQGRKAFATATADRIDVWDTLATAEMVKGYLIGDRVVPDGVTVGLEPWKVSEKVHLIESGLERFARVQACRMYDDGPLIYLEEDMPLGPESDVREAFEDRAESLDDVSNVHPALDAAFRLEVWQRAETDRRRAEAEQRRQQERERQEQQEKRARLREQLGDGAGRREMAKVDFEAAARAALRVAGADYLDHRKVGRQNEYAVKYKVDGQRLECTCDDTLHIIDAGICLTDHDTEEKGDTYFTLESLPGVIREAQRDNALVIWRHI